jgi:hypothetical protein
MCWLHPQAPMTSLRSDIAMARDGCVLPIADWVPHRAYSERHAAGLFGPWRNGRYDDGK